MTIKQQLSLALDTLRFYEKETNYYIGRDGVSAVDTDFGKLAARAIAEIGETRSATETESSKRLFTDGWCESFERHHNFKYKFAGAKDGRAADELLKLGIPVQELLCTAMQAWQRPAGFSCKFSASIATFSSKFNEIRAELKLPYGINGRNNAPNPRNVGTCDTTTDFEAASRKLQRRRVVEEVAEVRDESPTALADAAETLRLFKESL